MNWKLKLMQILTCFGECEGTWYECEWEYYGITKEERHEIAQIHAEWEAKGKPTT